MTPLATKVVVAKRASSATSQKREYQWLSTQWGFRCFGSPKTRSFRQTGNDLTNQRARKSRISTKVHMTPLGILMTHNLKNGGIIVEKAGILQLYRHLKHLHYLTGYLNNLSEECHSDVTVDDTGDPFSRSRAVVVTVLRAPVCSTVHTLCALSVKPLSTIPPNLPILMRESKDRCNICLSYHLSDAL